MFTLTICFTDAAKEWKFGFKTLESVTEYKMLIASARNGQHGSMTSMLPVKDLMIRDDYGQEAGVDISKIAGWSIDNLDLQAEANNQIALAQWRGHAKLEGLIQNDPDPDLKRTVAKMKQQRVQQQFPLGPMPQH